MFKKQNNPDNVSQKIQATPSLNMISEDTKLKGTIHSQSDLRIAGQLDGEVLCKGKIIITSTAKIEGNITAMEADIAGQILGTIKVSNKLILRKTAKIRGDLIIKALVIEEGATLNGSCRMGAMEKVENKGEADFDNNRKIENI